jgi:hypothetical protein
MTVDEFRFRQLKEKMRGRSAEEIRRHLLLAQTRAAKFGASKRGQHWAKKAEALETILKNLPQVSYGRLGGLSRSAAKVEAARANAAKARAARKPMYPRCPGYGTHRFDANGRCYSPACRRENPDLFQRGS